MPYLGGTSFSRILEALGEIPSSQRRGRHLLEVLDRLHAERHSAPTTDGPYRRYLEQASYVQAVCWIVACLADALHYAHSHELTHMDVKPSNVLIASDGLPMLLDFHLARRPIRAGERISDRLGGTRGWMAPEHAAALEAVSLGKPVPEPVDHRADLYALGLLLRDGLAGCRWAAGPNCPSDREQDRPDGVSLGLWDVVEKCVAPRPAARYPTAGALADDLRRHINDLPLRGVPNRSLAERWWKWRRRQPAGLVRGTAWLATLAAGIVAIVLGLAYYRQCVHEIGTALEDGRQFYVNHQFPEAIHALGRGLERASGLPFVDQLSQTLGEQLKLARHGQKAAELHRLADMVRFQYGAASAEDQARRLLRDIRTIWDERQLLLASPGVSGDTQIDERIRSDLLELVTVWAELRVRHAAASEARAAQTDALAVLDQASASCGSSPILERTRRSIARRGGRTDALDPSDTVPRTALDHADLGRYYLLSGRFEEAAREFQSVLDQRPQDFWPHFHEGVCAYRLERFQEAFAAFGTCVALAPTRAECYYNRGLAAQAIGKGDRAFLDYSKALELNPALTAAALNRGILAYRVGRHDEAVADLQRALHSTGDFRTMGLIHFNLALAHQARGDRSAALASAEQALAHGHNEARSLRDRLRRGS
jgi:tetratricopeptide (TPR) repeat protein